MKQEPSRATGRIAAVHGGEKSSSSRSRARRPHTCGRYGGALASIGPRQLGHQLQPLGRVLPGHALLGEERAHGLHRECSCGRQHIVAVRDHPAGLGLFLVPDDWPEAQRAVIKELHRRHDRLFRDVVEEGVAAGEFVVVDVDTILHCRHAVMTQASVWCRGLRGARLDHALDRLTVTLMMLVGQQPAVPGSGQSPVT